jgi:hypothetical protein
VTKKKGKLWDWKWVEYKRRRKTITGSEEWVEDRQTDKETDRQRETDRKYRDKE